MAPFSESRRGTHTSYVSPVTLATMLRDPLFVNVKRMGVGLETQLFASVSHLFVFKSYVVAVVVNVALFIVPAFLILLRVSSYQNVL